MSLTEDDKQWIDNRLEKLDTKLLTAFQQWASPNENRQRRYSAELHEFDSRLEYLEGRVKKLENPTT